MGDRIIQESKTISRKNLIKNLIDSCTVNIYKLEFIKLEICLLQYAYGLTQEETESCIKSINNIDKILRNYKDDLLKMKKESNG